MKAALKDEIYNYMITTGETSISKKDAIALASTAWTSGFENKAGNITAGFAEAGIRPLSWKVVLGRVTTFQHNGVPEDIPSPAWLSIRETIQTELLVLPPQPHSKQRRRKTVDIKRRLLTHDDLEASDC